MDLPGDNQHTEEHILVANVADGVNNDDNNDGENLELDAADEQFEYNVRQLLIKKYMMRECIVDVVILSFLMTIDFFSSVSIQNYCQRDYTTLSMMNFIINGLRIKFLISIFKKTVSGDRYLSEYKSWYGCTYVLSLIIASLMMTLVIKNPKNCKKKLPIIYWITFGHCCMAALGIIKNIIKYMILRPYIRHLVSRGRIILIEPIIVNPYHNHNDNDNGNNNEYNNLLNYLQLIQFHYPIHEVIMDDNNNNMIAILTNDIIDGINDVNDDNIDGGEILGEEVLSMEQDVQLLIDLGNLNTTCVICLDNFENGSTIRILECGHYFDGECIDNWLLRSQTCPLCRHQLNLLNPV
jgi:hypothetical protein